MTTAPSAERTPEVPAPRNCLPAVGTEPTGLARSPHVADPAGNVTDSPDGAGRATLDAADFDVRDYLDGAGAFLAGVANVIMQLSWAPVGHGVVESRVTGGQLTRHPYKRMRTTFTYIAVAMLGTDEERARFRDAVNVAHRQVRSTAASPVSYNAFRPDLQLWVAACLYWGAVDIHTRLHGPMEPAVADAFYQHAARFGTTLQVRPEMWPADRAAFDRYWDDALEQVAIDPTVRAYLRGLVTRRALRFPFNVGPASPLVFVTTGFLPPRFRDEMELDWSPADQERFDRLLRRTGAALRRLPRFARLFPCNLLMVDLRCRIRLGRKLA